MDGVEEFIKRFDVPPPPVPNIEVTIYMMSALGQPRPPCAAELEGVVKQLKSMFSYKALSTDRYAGDPDASRTRW